MVMHGEFFYRRQTIQKDRQEQAILYRLYGQIMHVRYNRNKPTVDARSHCDSI